MWLKKTLSGIQYDITSNNSIKKISSSNNKISTNSHQLFQNIHRKRSVLKSLFNKVSGLQPAALSTKRLWHRRFAVKLLRTRFFIEHLRTTTSGRFLEEPKILLKTFSIAIPNDIPKGCYQNGFIICFLRSTYGRDWWSFCYKLMSKVFLVLEFSLPLEGRNNFYKIFCSLR